MQAEPLGASNNWAQSGSPVREESGAGHLDPLVAPGRWCPGELV